VVPLDPIRKNRDPHGWWACLCNGIVVRIAAERTPLIRYASDPDYRAKPDYQKRFGRRMPADKGWSRDFDEPIPLPDGRKLRLSYVKDMFEHCGTTRRSCIR
jgi:hypothetical protein